MTQLIIRLACGHPWRITRGTLPLQGELLVCGECKETTHRLYDVMRDSTGEPHDVWRWRCTTEKCRRARRVGMSHSLAVIEASAHARSRPTHDVHVIDPQGLVTDRFGSDQLAYLPDLGEQSGPIPF
jgi:hypothetical protein